MEHFEIIYAGHKIEDTPKQLIQFLPTEKTDIETANRVVSAVDEDLEPILSHLIIWLQDLNWPVSQVIAPRLAKLSTKLKPVIVPIFKTNDHIWKYWILSELVNVEDLSLARDLRDELVILTEIDEQEGVADLAQEILNNLDN